MILGKRGITATLLWTIIALVLIALIAATFMLFIKDVKENTYFQKTYVAKDLALLLNKIQASPGEVQYHYFQERENRILAYNLKLLMQKGYGGCGVIVLSL